MTEQEQPRSTIAGTFELALNLTDKRQIKMLGYVYSDDTAAEINKRVDEFQDVLDRQGVRCDIVNKEAQVAAMTQNLRNLRDAYDELAERKRSGKTLTSQQKNNMDNYERSTKQSKEMIESLTAAITEGKKKLANGSAVGA